MTFVNLPWFDSAVLLLSSSLSSSSSVVSNAVIWLGVGLLGALGTVFGCALGLVGVWGVISAQHLLSHVSSMFGFGGLVTGGVLGVPTMGGPTGGGGVHVSCLPGVNPGAGANADVDAFLLLTLLLLPWALGAISFVSWVFDRAF